MSVIYPFWTLLIDSFSTPENVYSVGFRLWPRPATWDAYRDVLSKDTVRIAYYNTVLRTVAGTLESAVRVVFRRLRARPAHAAPEQDHHAADDFHHVLFRLA